MRVLVAPDSFKGSLTATEVCEVIGMALARHGVQAVPLPMADGGEGTIAAMLLASGGERVEDLVSGPLGERVTAARAVLPDGTAVVELAQAAGIHLTGGRRVAEATTFGVGQQLLAAARGGARRIIVALGGSGTTDGGCGAAAACGARFLDDGGAAFVPVGTSLARIRQLDLSGVDAALARSGGAKIVAMCDVDNPLTGADGAAAVFGPQKGADAETVRRLDAGLAHLAGVIRRDLGVEAERLPGAGAAGGMGAGLVAFFGAELRSGIEVMLDAVSFDELLAGADAVMTGEGSFDRQSLRGKVIHGVAARARRAGVPVHVLAGRVDPAAAAEASGLGVAGAQAITPEGQPLEAALAHARENLARAAEGLAGELARRRRGS